jgi:hypothetical protein
MTVESRTFFLESGREAARLKMECVRAARRGGGVVTVGTADGEHVEVLVTPGLAVFFDTLSLQPDVDCEEDQPSLEWEYTGAL